MKAMHKREHEGALFFLFLSFSFVCDHKQQQQQLQQHQRMIGISEWSVWIEQKQNITASLCNAYHFGRNLNTNDRKNMANKLWLYNAFVCWIEKQNKHILTSKLINFRTIIIIKPMCVYVEWKHWRCSLTLAYRARARAYNKTAQRIATQWLKSMVPFVVRVQWKKRKKTKNGNQSVQLTMAENDRHTRIT